MSILKKLFEITNQLELTGYCGLEIIDNEIHIVPKSSIIQPKRKNSKITEQIKVIEAARQKADAFYYKAKQAATEYQLLLEQLEKECAALKKLEEDGLFIQFSGRFDRTKNVNIEQALDDLAKIEQAEQESKSSTTATQSDSNGEVVGVPTLDQDNATAARTAPNSTGVVGSCALMNELNGISDYFYSIAKNKNKNTWEVSVSKMGSKGVFKIVYISDSLAREFCKELAIVVDKVHFVKGYHEWKLALNQPHFVPALIMIYGVLNNC